MQWFHYFFSLASLKFFLEIPPEFSSGFLRGFFQEFLRMLTENVPDIFSRLSFPSPGFFFRNYFRNYSRNCSSSSSRFFPEISEIYPKKISKTPPRIQNIPEILLRILAEYLIHPDFFTNSLRSSSSASLSELFQCFFFSGIFGFLL